MRRYGPFFFNCSPLLQEKSLNLTKKLLACQINTPPSKKTPLLPFLDLLLKMCIFDDGLHCSFFLWLGHLGRQTREDFQ